MKKIVEITSVYTIRSAEMLNALLETMRQDMPEDAEQDLIVRLMKGEIVTWKTESNEDGSVRGVTTMSIKGDLQ